MLVAYLDANDVAASVVETCTESSRDGVEVESRLGAPAKRPKATTRGRGERDRRLGGRERGPPMPDPEDHAGACLAGQRDVRDGELSGGPLEELRPNKSGSVLLAYVVPMESIATSVTVYVPAGKSRVSKSCSMT